MRKDTYKDLVGQKFNHLTVLSFCEERNGRYYWNCVCDCGNEKVVRGHNLMYGSSKSCGCIGKQKAKAQAAQLEGQRFGRLTVVKRVPHKRRDAYWLCKCDCGGETITNTHSLQNGHTSSCGCYNKEKVAENGRGTKRFNNYSVVNGIVYVELNKNQTMICDTDDWERLGYIKWNVYKAGYATGRDSVTGKTVFFHCEVIGRKDGLVVDHINHNKLDNRKSNLRLVPQRVNMLNKLIIPNAKSGVPGVSFHHGKWEAKVWVHKKPIKLGRFDNMEDAVRARKEAEETYYNPLLEVRE